MLPPVPTQLRVCAVRALVASLNTTYFAGTLVKRPAHGPKGALCAALRVSEGNHSLGATDFPHGNHSDTRPGVSIFILRRGRVGVGEWEVQRMTVRARP